MRYGHPIVGEFSPKYSPDSLRTDARKSIQKNKMDKLNRLTQTLNVGRCKHLNGAFAEMLDCEMPFQMAAMDEPKIVHTNSTQNGIDCRVFAQKIYCFPVELLTIECGPMLHKNLNSRLRHFIWRQLLSIHVVALLLAAMMSAVGQWMHSMPLDMNSVAERELRCKRMTTIFPNFCLNPEKWNGINRKIFSVNLLILSGWSHGPWKGKDQIVFATIAFS